MTPVAKLCESFQPPMAALDYITIKGFKSISSIEKLKLEPINVLIGPNGSGKSNFIGAFSFLHAIREGRMQQYVAEAGGADRVLHFGSRTTETLELEIQFWKTNRYEISLSSTDADDLIPIREQAWYFAERFSTWTKRPLARNGKEAGISREKQEQSIASYVRGYLSQWRVYHFHDTSSDSPMKKTSDVNDNRYLRADASNLAAYLYFLSEKYPNEYGLVKRIVQRVAPFFDDFILQPLKLNEDKIRLEWKHKNSDAYFDGASLSDGSLRFIALATLLAQPYQLRPSVILIDEPELGLHPFAITMLASLVKQASKKTQVIVSTQSPMLLDHFDPENVLVADRVEGGTTLHRLETDPLKAWLEDYSLGQLWEKNELGGRPAAE